MGDVCLVLWMRFEVQRLMKSGFLTISTQDKYIKVVSVRMNSRVIFFKAALYVALGLVNVLCPAWSQTPQEPTNTHRWLTIPPWHDPAAAFTNLKNNDRVVSPFVVQFGMSNWGIAPAKHDHPKTGHHHLLVDAPLPIPITAPIPFSKNYVHFGAGQMQTVLDLP